MQTCPAEISKGGKRQDMDTQLGPGKRLGSGYLGQKGGQVAFYWLQVCAGCSLSIIPFDAPHLLVRWCESPFSKAQGGYIASWDSLMI